MALIGPVVYWGNYVAELGGVRRSSRVFTRSYPGMMETRAGMTAYVRFPPLVAPASLLLRPLIDAL